MPWEKTFNLDDAIDRATQVFWSKGYEASSLSDLLKAIGINKGSFYNAFGSKKKLFTESLYKYEREQRRDVLAGFEALKDPLKAIERFFDAMIQQSLNDTDKKGCFIVNTALDLPHHDDDIQTAVNKALKDTERFFKQQIELGIKTGAIATAVNADECAKALLTLLVGLRVLARGVFDKTSLTAIKTQALALIKS